MRKRAVGLWLEHPVSVSSVMERMIYVSDVTMKQAVGLHGESLSFRQKIELAKLLDKLGVSVIETAPIRNGRSDSLLVKSLASAIKDSTLAVPVDIMSAESVQVTWNALRDARHPRLQVCVPVSAVQMEYLCHLKPADILALIGRMVSACAECCPEVEFVAEDSGRSDSEFLGEAVKAAVAAGAKVVTVCDAAGNLLPDEFHASVAWVRRMLPEGIRLGVLCSNLMFQADSCAIAAVRAGADEIKTAPYGNTTVSLKRFVKILDAKSDLCKARSGVRVIDLERTVGRIRLLCEAKPAKSFKPLEGPDIDRDALTLTAHDDRDAVLKVVSKLGYDLSGEDADRVYETFVRLAARSEVVEAKELDAIVASVAYQVPPTYKLESYVINSGNIISATCHLRLRKDDGVLESVCVGDGPVDAAFQAVDKVVGRQYELDDFQIRSVAEGREAMGEAVVRLRFEGKVYSGRGISRDIVGSSLMAYLNAVNKMAYEEGEA